MRLTMFFALLCVACSHASLPAPLVRPAVGGNLGKVVVLKGKKAAFMEQAAQAFLDTVDAQVTVFSDVQDADADALVAAIYKAQPQLVMAFGGQAATLAAEHFNDVPVLFAMVLNYKIYSVLKHPNVAGIAMEPTPQAEFVRFRMLDGDLRILDIPYTLTVSDDLAKAVKEQLAPMGVSVRLYPVAMGADAATALRARKPDEAKADGMWLINDPWVMKQFEALRALANQDKTALLTSLSDKFVQEGAFLSVSVDIPSVGTQAAALARLVLEHGKTAHDLGVQLPIGLKLAANRAVAKNLGRDFGLDVLPFINELVEEAQARTP